MSFGPDLQLVERALDAIEQREAKLLVWGIVDAFLTEREMQDLLQGVLEQSADLLASENLELDSVSALLKALEQGVLITAVDGGYRSRMAEGLRLMARLRQLFQKHSGDAWATAPTLVSDFRFTWRRRRYPKRDIPAEEALERLVGSIQTPLLGEAVRHYVGGLPEGYRYAAFQVDAAARILAGLERRVVEGTLIGAGTGSGKTLAFYIPALSWLTKEVVQNDHQGVQILAVYPRNELLKDQFAEVYSQCRRFDEFLAQHGKRRLTIGVLYGDTPYTAKAIEKNWERRGDGFVCPYMACPAPNCNGRLIARRQDLTVTPLRLVCNECGHTVDEEEVLLTRNQLRSSPPDILFTTVEMMNQRLSDSEIRHVFGVGPSARRSPRLVLLDEVHIYGGTYGAQVAYLLRRWRHLTKHRSSFVGLSATLANGGAFFSAITGLHESAVAEISPRLEDLTSEGAEYMVALRGDPVSRSALLSTSIQTAMLATRLLDPKAKVPDRPFFGWRTFAFTDQVDAANRLFHDLLDAEGFYKNGNPNLQKHPRGGLAHLRTEGASASRYRAGQDWRLAEKVGHQLSARHQVSRTTAADRGVSTDTPHVVATAALEVGYDDPHVGVVIQHKAPRDVAQFLQRKGRAGRTRHMRPWTIVVLSDYGRDRIAYQAYDQLFDPEVPARTLPLVNRYIKRIQAGYGLIDYLGVKTQISSPRGSVWRDLTGPNTNSAELKELRTKLESLFRAQPETFTDEDWKRARSNAMRLGEESGLYARLPNDRKWEPANWLQSRLRQRLLVSLLRRILDDSREQEAFADFLHGALALENAEVSPLLWEQPRPMLLGAAPTALRRLASDWRAFGQVGADYVGDAPLPEYVPANLFSDLNLPEIRVDNVGPNREPKELGFLPVLQGMDELAPGKVSKRYDLALWLGPDGVVEQDQPIEVGGLYDVEAQPPLQVAAQAGGVQEIPSFRPYAVKLRAIPNNLRETSNARLEWTTQIFARFPGAKLDVPRGLKITELIESITVHMHGLETPATIRRYALASLANPRIKGKEEDFLVRYDFVHEGKPCALGFEISADGLVIILRLPENLAEVLVGEDGARLRAIRMQRFFYDAKTDAAFSEAVPNSFRRDWLAQIFLTAVCVAVLRNGDSIELCTNELSRNEDAADLKAVLDGIFQSPYSEEEGDKGGDEASDKLRADLNHDLDDPRVLEALGALSRVLFEPIDDAWSEWFSTGIKDTFGGAFLSAIQEFCPEVSVDALIVDTGPGIDPASGGQAARMHEIWISETNPGGNGLIEAFVDAYTREPAKFMALLEAGLGASEFERVDEQMRAVIKALGGAAQDEELAESVARVRNAKGVSVTAQAHEALRLALVVRGLTLFHTFSSCLGNRLLRAGMPADLDVWLYEAISKWDTIEKELGVEIDARLAAYVLSDDASIDAMLQAAGFPVPRRDERLWRLNAVYGLLWSRGFAVRSAHLQFSNRFDRSPRVFERLLLAPWITPMKAPIRYSDAAWREKLIQALTASGRGSVECAASDHEALRNVLSHVTINPVQLEYLNLYSTVAGVTRRGDSTVIELEVPGGA
jgi:RAD3-like DEAD/DEAH box helicase/helicase-like protein